jgi:hypothetical protein
LPATGAPNPEPLFEEESKGDAHSSGNLDNPINDDNFTEDEDFQEDFAENYRIKQEAMLAELKSIYDANSGWTQPLS